MLYKLFSRNMRSHSIRIAIKYAWPKLITNKRYFSSIWGIRKKIFRAFMRSSRNKVTIDVRCKWWISGRSCLYKIEFANLQTNVAMSRVCPILNPCKVVNDKAYILWRKIKNIRKTGGYPVIGSSVQLIKMTKMGKVFYE